jgi:sugar/nucleoside kinase (ribokinase family)
MLIALSLFTRALNASIKVQLLRALLKMGVSFIRVHWKQLGKLIFKVRPTAEQHSSMGDKAMRYPYVYHIVGIGNAIVDVLALVDDEFLIANGLVKGTMTLTDESQIETLRSRIKLETISSGGSAANTINGISLLGGKAAYIGKVSKDPLGLIFKEDMLTSGVYYKTPPLSRTLRTACCLILVTPDAQRTMSTYLGASLELEEQDVDITLIESSQVIYLESYLLDQPKTKAALVKATTVARSNNCSTALNLSDRFCVDRHRDSLRELIHNYIDILFCNEDEILALLQTNSLSKAIDGIREHCKVAVITRGAMGSLIVERSMVFEIMAKSVPQVVDTTGAGDLFVSGFLYGLTHNRSLFECGSLGSIIAAEAIKSLGARPKADLKALVQN